MISPNKRFASLNLWGQKLLNDVKAYNEPVLYDAFKTSLKGKIAIIQFALRETT